MKMVLYKDKIMENFQLYTECVLVCFCMFIPCVELNCYEFTFLKVHALIWSYITTKFEGENFSKLMFIRSSLQIMHLIDNISKNIQVSCIKTYSLVTLSARPLNINKLLNPYKQFYLRIQKLTTQFIYFFLFSMT